MTREQFSERVAGEDRAGGKEAERKDHDERALARGIVMVVVVWSAVERQKDQPPRIECGERRCDHRRSETIERDRVATHIGRLDDGIL